MLKLERIAKGRDLNIILRDKPSLYSARFLFALGYALLIHILAMFFFRIPPFSLPSFIGEKNPIIFVALDTSQADKSIHGLAIAIEEGKQMPSYLIAPGKPLPSLDHMEIPLAEIASRPSIEGLKVFSNPFFSVENSIAIQQESTLFAAIQTHAPVSLNLSGPLAEMALLYRDFHDEELIDFLNEHPEASHASPSQFTFNVLVDQERGELCWWEMLPRNGDNTFAPFATAVIQSLRFAPKNSALVERGAVEVSISPSSCIFR